MNQKYRILHADDSSVVRKLLGEVFERSQKCEIAFSAKHGKEAVDNFRRIDPDVVVLDVEMPVMDGIEATTAIRAMSPQVPIIMCSSLTTRGGEATLDALARGATDYVAKPTGSGHLDDALKQLSDELVPKVLTWAARYRKHPAVGDEGRALASTSHPPVQRTSRAIEQDGGRRPRRAAPVRVVAVGVSTGGPTALASLLSQLPRDLDVP
ncbi:MAG: response regulator, partial [Planctomycetales bacterium]|nr:response regulator [Planctomycetales bacterium]